MNSKNYQFNDSDILIVDDEPYNCMALINILLGLGIDKGRIATAYDGEAALEKLGLSDGPIKKSRQFGLIFCDCSMPFMDGYELSKRIRTLTQHASSPKIIAVTGHVEFDY